MSEADGETGTAARWAATALWAAAGVCALRVGLALADLCLHRGLTGGPALWTLAGGFPRLVCGAVLVCFAIGFDAGRGGALRFALDTALLAAVLVGRPFESAYASLGAGWWPGWFLAVVLGLVTAAAFRTPLLRARPARPAIPLLVLVAAAVGLGMWGASAAPPHRVKRLYRELLFEPETRWEVIEANPDAQPCWQVLAPSLYPVPGAPAGYEDRPALVMTPPCKVRIPIRREDGPVVLRTAAGVHFELANRIQGEAPAARVRFEVFVNGESVFDETLAAHREDFLEQRYWHAVGGEQGLALRPGDEVLLSTSLVGPPPEVAPEHFLVGFSGLQLERHGLRPFERARPSRPNILYIVQDTQRADRMGCYGYEARDTTPHADRLARRGLLFEEAFATSSWTWPATASMLTGLLPEEHGVVSNSSCYLGAELDTLAEVLQSQGYATAAFSGNWLIVESKGFHQGFDLFDGDPRDFRKTDEVLPGVLSWLEENAPQRFFLYLHLVDPHTPHRPLRAELERLGIGPMPVDLPEGPRPDIKFVDPLDVYAGVLNRRESYDEAGNLLPERAVPEEHARWLSDSYDAAVATGDHYLGVILDRLAELGLEQNTVVVFTSDHGEELLDHGHLAHGHALHRELVRVPLILAGPGIPRGERVGSPVSNRHLAPTLARIGGGELAGDGGPQIDLSRADGHMLGQAYYSLHKGWWNGRGHQVLVGLRTRDLAFQWAPTGADWGAAEPPEGGQVRLFDVQADPTELRDVAAERADEAAVLAQEARARLIEADHRRATHAIGVGAAGQQGLEVIGYSDGNEPVEAEPDPDHCDQRGK